LLGLAECMYLPAATALIADHHGPDTRGTAMSIQVAGMQTGLIAGSAVAGYIGEHLGWRADFFILGAVGLAFAAIASLVLRDGPMSADVKEQRSVSFRDTLKILRIPGYVAVVGGAMLIAAGTWIFLNWLPLYFHERFGLSLAGAGFSSSSMLQVAAVLGVMIGGVISDRTAGRSPRGRILLLAICYFCAAPFLLTFRTSASLTTINAAIFCYSFIQSVGTASECPIICEVIGPRLRSTGLGILNMLNCFSGGIGVMWAGILKSHYGLAAAFSSVSATVTIAGAVVLTGYFLVRRQERQLRTVHSFHEQLQ
jgi:MFS transporter, Spinster family, sphingosine-1-phosphate transporter